MFSDGKLDGQGIYTYSNGDKYVGEWKNDNMDGQGTYIINKVNILISELN